MTTVVYASDSTEKVFNFNTLLQSGNDVARLQNMYTKDLVAEDETYWLLNSMLKQHTGSALASVPWNSGVEWKLATKYEIRGVEQHPVLWIGYNDDGDMMAYCHGLYDYSTGMFSDIYFNKIIR